MNLLVVDEGGKLKTLGAQFIHMEAAYDAAIKGVTLDISVFEVDGSGRLKSGIHDRKIKPSDADWTAGDPQKRDINDADIKAEFADLFDWWMPD